MLQELCLGNSHYFEVALLLRNLLFVNSLLQSSESWYPITQKDMNELVLTDKILIKKIFGSCSSVPSELLFLESGALPIDLIIQSRRIMFLHHILTRDNNALIKKFFLAQERNPTRGDWSILVKKDLEEFGMNMTNEEIAACPKTSFKIKVKEACAKIAFQNS